MRPEPKFPSASLIAHRPAFGLVALPFQFSLCFGFCLWRGFCIQLLSSCLACRYATNPPAEGCNLVPHRHNPVAVSTGGFQMCFSAARMLPGSQVAHPLTEGIRTQSAKPCKR